MSPFASLLLQQDLAADVVGGEAVREERPAATATATASAADVTGMFNPLQTLAQVRLWLRYGSSGSSCGSSMDGYGSSSGSR